MEVTRNVILDLLPLYLADELSEDTKQLVEHYLERDPKLAQLMEHAGSEQLPQEIPLPINKESEMKTYRKARLLMLQHHIFLGLAILFTVLWVIFAYATMVQTEIPTGIPMIFFFAASLFWIGFGNIMYRINKL